jgi:hypothetical protein
MRPYSPKESKWRIDRVLKVAAKGVVYELNSAKRLTVGAVSRLADMLTALHALRAKGARGDLIHPDEAKPINEYLKRHRWVFQLTIPGLDFQNMQVIDERELADTEEQRVADMVIFLASRGTLERVQRCNQCGTWFYSRRLRLDPTKGAFCSDACRKLFWRARPDVKKHLRKYQKDYYRDVLSPVTSRAVRRKKRRSA